MIMKMKNLEKPKSLKKSGFDRLSRSCRRREKRKIEIEYGPDTTINSKEEGIRKRKSYKIFDELYGFCKQNSGNPDKLFNKIYHMIDNNDLFVSERYSKVVLESLNQLKKDKNRGVIIGKRK